MKNQTDVAPAIQRLFLPVFFLSGFSALIYEIIWIRELSVVFGKSILPASVVVSVFMAGLGLGSLYIGRYADRREKNLMLFSTLQTGIALCAVMLLFLFSFLAPAYRWCYQLAGGSSFAAGVMILILSSLLMFFPAFLMGGTFPVISRSYLNFSTNNGKSLGSLYAANTLGSILGAGLAGFYLIGSIGQINTVLIAVFINILCALASRFMLKEQTIIKRKEEKRTKKDMASDRYLQIVLFAAGISGFCSLCIEILCTRALSIFISNSTYSFSAILVMFLTGIALGSFLFSRFFAGRGNYSSLLPVCFLVPAAYMMFLSAYLNDLPALLPAFRSLLNIPVFRTLFPGLFLSFITVFIPALFAGISFPALCHLYLSAKGNAGEKIGKTVLINTAGSIAGPLCAAFFFIPVIGVVRGIILTALAGLITSFILLFSAKNKLNKRYYFIFMMIALSGILFSLKGLQHTKLLPPSVYRTALRSDKVLYYHETTEGTVLVSEDRYTGIRACYVNNNTACGTTYDALKIVRMLGHLPFIVNPQAKNALIIGFGTGVTTSAMAQHKATIDAVEICPGVKQAAHYFNQYNRNVVQYTALNFISGDGRSYLLATGKIYDVISCDPIHPALGSGNLYTREFFQLCRDHLTAQGVMTQYLPLHKITTSDFKILIRTFREVFPHASVWLGHSHCLLMGTVNDVSVDFRQILQTLISTGNDLLNDPYLFSSCLLLDRHAVSMITANSPVNDDNRPRLEFFSPASWKNENWHLNLSELLKFKIHPSAFIKNIDDSEKMERYLEGRSYFLQALISRNKNEQTRVIELYRKAMSVNPENEEIKMFLKYELWQNKIMVND